MTVEKLDVASKALSINLDPKIYGTFAEIGAGQEVARQFFTVGAAAGTVAKTMSAYDMKFSDAIYGKSGRYVSRDRLLSMLDHEYSLLIERLEEARGDESLFFAFANTVSARNYQGTNECHGWMGIRFQLEPRGEPNNIVLHLRMHDKTNLQQQRAIGMFGVNLIHGAFAYPTDQLTFIKSITDELSAERIEVDMIEFLGPAFRDVDSRLMSLKLVEFGLTEAIMFGPDRRVKQPSEAFYKRSVLFQRGTFKPITNINLEVFHLAKSEFEKALGEDAPEPVEVLEISVNNLLRTGELNEREFLDLADTLCAEGFNVLISDYPEYYRLISHLRRFTSEPIGVAIGVNSLIHVFANKYYENLRGGILEAFGKLFSEDVKLYVYPMAKEVYEIFLLTSGEDFSPDMLPEGDQVNADNFVVEEDLRSLYKYLSQTHRIEGLQGVDVNHSSILPTDVVALIRKGDSSWENHVPTEAAKLIKERNMFGFKHP